MRYFLALSRAGSLKEAAQTLGVNQSTVYRRIQHCESELGVKLFDRTPQGHELTPAGKQMQQFAEQTERGMGELVTELHGQDVSLSGAIHITSTDIVASTLLLPAVSEFRKAYPGIHLHVSIDPQRYDLSSREADIALRPTLAPPAHLSGVCLLEVDWAIYAPEGVPLPRDTAALGDLDAIAGDGQLAGIPAVQWFADLISPERTALHTSSVATMVEAMKSERAIAMLPTFVAEVDGTLVRAPVDTGYSVQVWLLTHPEIRKAARIRAFFEFMTRRFSDTSSAD